MYKKCQNDFSDLLKRKNDIIKEKGPEFDFSSKSDLINIQTFFDMNKCHICTNLEKCVELKH